MAIRLSKNGKRLGRPPKNAGKVFISELAPVVKKEEVEEKGEFDSLSMIECELVSIPQYAHDPKTETKSGRYMTSIYSIDGFGSKKWVVGAYLKTDWDKHRVIKTGDYEIVRRCVNYLNSLGKKKKKYGNLQLFSKKINFVQKNGETVAVVELITDERKNENFWGEGEKV